MRDRTIVMVAAALGLAVLASQPAAAADPKCGMKAGDRRQTRGASWV